MALKALASSDSRVSAQAAQYVAAIAATELPKNMWPQLMPNLVENVGGGRDNLKQASLQAIGYICDGPEQEMQAVLAQFSNSILTAVVQGARKEEPNNDVRNSAISALSDSLEFVRNNFENEGERNYIMQVICEATQANDSRVVQGAFGCLNRIMALYYEKMYFYMEKALFGLTVQGMKNDDEDIAKLAVEFWCTVCEEEIAIEDDNSQAEAEGSIQRPYFNFSKIATAEVVPVLLELLSKQDEDAADDEYNLQRAAYQCLSLWAQAVGNAVVSPVLAYVEANIRSEDWHLRDASASAFGAIMEGPEEKMLDNIVKQALPVLISMMSDSSLIVKDSVAFTLGRISECVANSIDVEKHLPALVESLFAGLASHPKMASSCCWALMNLAQNFSSEQPGAETNAMTPYFDPSISALLQATERNDADSQVRTAAYEVLNVFITNAASKSLATVAQVNDTILQRLESSIPLRQQALTVDDRLTLDDIQTSLCTVTMAIIQRCDSEIAPQADRIMHILLQLLGSLNSKSSVADSALGPIGALATALETGFQKYMDAFRPYLFKALNNRDEPSLCAMAIGLTSDIVRALGTECLRYCDDFMNSLLENLRSTSLGNQFKPAILQCFGDIAHAIGGSFETYLGVVAQVLDQAASIHIDQVTSYEVLDYIVSLREGIMDAWAGAIVAMQSGQKQDRLKPYVEPIFRLLHMVASDQNRSEALLRSSLGVMGDVADCFPNGEFADFYRQDWVSVMIKETKSNREYASRTIQTAKWAREQVKKQTGSS